MIAEMLPLYCIIAISLLTLLVAVGIAWEVRRVDSHVMRLLDGRKPGDPVYIAPVYSPFRPGECAADAHAWERQQERLARAADVGALVGRVDGLGHAGRMSPPQRARRWVACSPDGERIDDGDKTPISPVSTNVLLALREEQRKATELPAYNEVSALGEDEDDTRMWQKRSGTFTRSE